MREDFSHMGQEIGEVKMCIGEIRGRQDLQILALDEIKTGIKELTANGNALKTEAAVEKAKLTPLFWVLMIVGGIVLTTIVSSAIHYIWPTAVVSETQFEMKNKAR
jgi:hypothetical protein